MSAYLDEEEQVEALKNWWKENGRSVIAGAVLGLAAIFGWQGWQGWQRGQAEAASMLYEQMLGRLRAGDVDAAQSAGKRLLGEFTDSIYASFAAMKLARTAYEKGESDTAVENLQWVAAHAPDSVIGDLARVRLVRVLVDAGKQERAERVLSEIQKDFMPAVVAELRGDIARAKGDTAAAREAYEAAMRAGATNELVRMKHQALGKGGEAS